MVASDCKQIWCGDRKMKFKAGDKVRFIGKREKQEFPEFYPNYGTIGTISGAVYSDTIWVQWAERSTIGDDRWNCEIDDVELVEQPKLQTIHHQPIVYRVYDVLKTRVGSENAISAEDLAAMFDTTKRGIRKIIHTIRKSGELEKAIGSNNNGYFVCTKEDAEKAIQRLLNQAFNTLKVARALEKKVGLNGQIKLKLGEYFNDTYQSLGE